MELSFDLDQDELPIFLAETDEQLQVLDEGLIRLEQESGNTELVQALFRAAHTLKGTSGMIGHKRMVTLTHALENALDGVRKQTVIVTTLFVDLCLEAVDALRLLREEVLERKSRPVDVEKLAGRFSLLSLTTKADESVSPKVSSPSGEKQTGQKSTDFPQEGYFIIEAKIAENSIASAARAMQLYMTLQSLGEILEMQPTQEEIETAKPVYYFKSRIKTDSPLEIIQKELMIISEIDSIAINSGTKAVGAQFDAPVQSLSPAILNNEINKRGDSDSSKPASVASAAEKTVRTSVERLDNLMNLVGELITDRNRLFQVRSNFEARFRGDEQIDSLTDTVAHIGRITDQLQKEVMSIRMLPVANVFHKFPRMIRDLANKFNKKVDLEIEGEDTELDRSVIEEITDPLIHLVRNSIDHGIETIEERVASGKGETSRILLQARHEQGRILLTVEDDGRGINTARVKASAVQKGVISEAEAAAMNEDDAINLIFSSGLSTAKVVSDISGRGVGLDIVRNNIQRLSGSIMIETWPGRGTRFQISLPLTLAIVPTLLVKVHPCIFAIPLVTVLETLRITETDIKKVGNFPVVILREHVLPLINLSETFKLPKGDEKQKHLHVVVVGIGKNQMGLIVDTLLGQEEVVVKSMGALIGEISGISSAAILGDGQVILILDVQDLSRHVSASR